MLVRINVKAMLLDVASVSVKDAMGQPARITVSVTKHVPLQNHKLEAELKTTEYSYLYLHHVCHFLDCYIIQTLYLLTVLNMIQNTNV